jgi:hypothetical protein
MAADARCCSSRTPIVSMCVDCSTQPDGSTGLGRGLVQGTDGTPGRRCRGGRALASMIVAQGSTCLCLRDPLRGAGWAQTTPKQVHQVSSELTARAHPTPDGRPAGTAALRAGNGRGADDQRHLRPRPRADAGSRRRRSAARSGPRRRPSVFSGRAAMLDETRQFRIDGLYRRILGGGWARRARMSAATRSAAAAQAGEI